MAGVLERLLWELVALAVVEVGLAL